MKATVRKNYLHQDDKKSSPFCPVAHSRSGRKRHRFKKLVSVRQFTFMYLSLKLLAEY